MTPAKALAMLDRHVSVHGQDVVLRRYSGLGETRTAVNVTVRALVRGYAPREIVGGVAAGDVRVIISPTQILAAAWPGPQGWPAIGDHVEISGREHFVKAAPAIRMAGTVVRLDLQVEG